MKPSTVGKFFTDTVILCLLGLGLFLVHMLTNHQYGFHQDEMVVLDNAYHLSWGYVEYPPITPFLTRIALELFEFSMVSARFFAALAQSICLVLTGLMARELGGKRITQVVAALVAAIAPIALAEGAIVMYVTFDFLWSVLVAYFTIRLLKSDNPRWWLAVGACIGLGMMTKYTMAFFTAGLVGGVLLTRARKYLTSPWLWAGVALSLLIFLPNLIWQIQHQFISLEFLNSIHARDVMEGRGDGYLLEQFVLSSNPFVFPFWVAGLYYFFFHKDGKRYRLLGWTYIITFLFYLLNQGQSYYLAPTYPMLIAAGAILWQRWLEALAGWKSKILQGVTWGAITLGALFAGVIALPIAPINSDLFKTVADVHGLFTEQLGWPEMVETMAKVYASLPPEEQARAGIFTWENDEAAALNVFGPAKGLPKAISTTDNFWLRGYGNPPPEILIVFGMEPNAVYTFFDDCKLAGRVTNQYNIDNDLVNPPQIYVCRKVRYPWPELWEKLKHYS